MKRWKRKTMSVLLALAMLLSLGTVLLPLQARAAGYETFDTSKTYYL